MKKQQLLFYLAFIMSIMTMQAQDGFCPGNIFDNGDLEIGTPTNGDQDIDLAIFLLQRQVIMLDYGLQM